MGLYVVALLYVWLAQLLAIGLLYRTLPIPMFLRSAILWPVVAGIVFVFVDALASLVLVGLAMAAIAPVGVRERVALFVAAVPSTPYFLKADLPFPGINTLFELSHFKICVIVFLLPALILVRHRVSLWRLLTLSGASLIVYSFLATFVVLEHATPTWTLRFLVEQLLALVIPFVVIRLALRSWSDLDALFIAFLVASVFLATIALVSTLKRWEIYSILQPMSAFTAADLRSGFVRIRATVGTHSLGFQMAAGLIILQYLSTRIDIGWIQINILRVLMLLGLYFTDSRAAMVALCIMIVVYAFSCVGSRAIRAAVGFAALLALLYIAYLLATFEFSTEGSSGSVVYRQELLRISVPYMFNTFPWGDYHFAKSPEFRPLIQGQGIVDVTNLYLEIGLPFGILALTFFIVPYIVSLLSVLKRLIFYVDEPLAGAAIERRDRRTQMYKRVAGLGTGLACAVLFFVVTAFDWSVQLRMTSEQATLVQMLVAVPLLIVAMFAPMIVLAGHEPWQFATHRKKHVAWRAPLSEFQKRMRATGVLCSVLIAWLFLITTTSTEGTTVFHGLLFAAMAQPIGRFLSLHEPVNQAPIANDDVPGGLAVARA